MLRVLLRLLLCGCLATLCSTVRAEDAAPDSAAAAAIAPDSRAYLDQLLAEAERQHLDQDRYWRVLLHYKDGLLGAASVVDDPKFFADPNGKHDPKAELRATLASFFTPALTDTTGGKKHPVCRFAARLEWLKEKLRIDERRLPVPRCEPLETLLAQIQPESATVIFPTAHMNSPASMYGHTLLTIETASKSKLLAYAVNYSAMTSGTNFAPVYMAKGLLGGYPGYFSVLPYYAKLQEYSDVNDRDIWEYPLNLSREEVDRLVRHTYELDSIATKYFFFGENCSYGLLFLLDAARPSLHLSDRFSWWVIPIDTIRSVKKAGLMEGAIYRPSKSTKIEYLSHLVDKKGRDDAWDLSHGRETPDSVLARADSTEEKIRVFDLATEYLQYAYARGDISKAEYLPRFLKTLEARSSLGATEEWRYSIPPPPRPDAGHRSDRRHVGGGVIEDEPFQELRLRPAYHTLLDRELGYKRGSQIVFVDAAVRYYSDQRRAKLESVDLIDIMSLAPRTRFFKHVSWKVRTAFYRRTLANHRQYFVWGLNPGAGLAREQRLLGLGYALLETDLNVGGALQDRYALGGGGSIGLIKDIGPWRGIAQARYLRYELGDQSDLFEVSFAQRATLSPNTQLSVTVERRREHGLSRDEVEGGFDLFF